jgi:rfaE bifunctional protein nucleotidyltransferase chain/domain/rfaE bifunctional protein kinase chain/domain
VVVGDALLDLDLDGRAERLAPDAPVPVVDDPTERPRPGGAALAATLAALLDRREVVLVTALARDEPAATLRKLLALAGVAVVDLGLAGATAEKIRVRADGRSLLRLDRGSGRGTIGPLGDAGRRAIAGAAAVLVSDYGRGLAAEPEVRAALASRHARVPLVWDPHPKGPDPVPGARLATPNRAEAALFAAEVPGDGLAAVTARARLLAERWRAAGVAVTLGPSGALLVQGGGAPLVVPAPAAPGGDPCGAGDRFASAAAGLLADGALPSEAVSGAVVAATAFVAAGGAATAGSPPGAPTGSGSTAATRAGPGRGVPGAGADREGSAAGGTPLERALALAARVRARGGTVVATGGCFDLLHAGHVATLRSARALGDCLLVCLNSDGSVRRLKGPERPLVPEADRIAVLEALDCVDVVVPFDERTPEALLARLRPDVFAKGGDYTLADLPEAATLAAWGGQAVVLPYLEGRSTTKLIKEVARRDNR